MATGSGDPDADRGMGIGPGASGYEGGGSVGAGSNGGDGLFDGLIGKYSNRTDNFLGSLWEAAKSFMGGPVGAIAGGIKNAADYEKAASKARADMKAKGMSDAEIAQQERDYLGSLGLGEGSPAGTQGTNQGGTTAAASNEFGKIIEQEAANANPSIVDQFGSLFQGVGAPFNMKDMLTKNQQSIADADKKYSDASASIMDKWNQFEKIFDQYYGSMSSQYDTLNADYDQNRNSYNDVLNQQKTNAGQYDTLLQGYQDKARSIPQLNLTLPGGMGGGSFSLAPTKWNDVYSNQAKTSGDLLGQQLSSINSQNDTLSNQLANINSKKSAFDAKADLLQPWSTQQSNAISNQGIQNQNDYNTRMKSLQALMEPFNLGYDIYDRDKQIAANVALQDSQLDALKPNSFDKWAPIAAAAMPSVINIGKDLFGSLFGGGTSAAGGAIGGGLSW